MKIKRRRRKIRLRIERMLFSSDVTKLRSDVQNLQRGKSCNINFLVAHADSPTTKVLS